MELRISDLRIGNLIKDKHGSIHVINKGHFEVLEGLIRDGIALPIEINEDWLLKLGFVKRHPEGSVWIMKIEDFDILLNSTATENKLPYHLSVEQFIEGGMSIQEAALVQKEWNDFNDEPFILKHYSVHTTILNHIHHLQNIFHSLTGKELIYTP